MHSNIRKAHPLLETYGKANLKFHLEGLKYQNREHGLYL